MIDRIKRLFAAMGDAGPTPPGLAGGAGGVDELHLALCDDSFDEVERTAVAGLVASRFELTESQALGLVAAGEKASADATHLLRFTRVIKDNFSPAERVELIEMIWEVVYADGVLHDYEDSLLRRIAGLIYVSDRDRGAARKRVLARLGEAGDGLAV
jgi:uncharacterized tellurite resistance protein B-like protein